MSTPSQLAALSVTGRVNDDLRMVRARFYLQQYSQCRQELDQLPPEVSQLDKDFWSRRLLLETQLTNVAQNQFTMTPNADTNIAFQEHLMNLYGIFVLSPQNDTKVQILQQIEQYMYQPELYNNIFLHIYGSLMFWKSNKITLARDLLTRTSSSSSSTTGTTTNIQEQPEFLLEKLYIMVQILVQKQCIDNAKQIVEQMAAIDNDDILVQLAEMDILGHTPTAKPDNDEDTPLLILTNEINSRYGVSLLPLVYQSSELLRQNNYRRVYTTLKQAKDFCSSQNLPFPAEVQINSIICLYYRSFTTIGQTTTGTPTFTQQQQQLDNMITTLENELKQAYPNHPFFTQRQTILEDIKQSINANNIPTV